MSRSPIYITTNIVRSMIISAAALRARNLSGTIMMTGTNGIIMTSTKRMKNGVIVRKETGIGGMTTMTIAINL